MNDVTPRRRARTPDETLALIEPRLRDAGITRCADYTGLDVLGVPVHGAVRPGSRTVQVNCGKGLTHEGARASALMEALEFHALENADRSRLVRASAARLRDEGRAYLAVEDVPPRWFREPERHRAPTRQLSWIDALDLVSRRPTLVPACAVHFDVDPGAVSRSTNGAAAGNDVSEATLHALCELLERDAFSRVRTDEGKWDYVGRCKIVDPLSVPPSPLRETLDRVSRSGARVVLLWAPCPVRVHAFMAVFLAPDQPSITALSIGYGTHPNAELAAIRAVSEAAQTRIDFLTGARQDYADKGIYHLDVSRQPLYRYFDRLQATTEWAELEALGYPDEIDPARTCERLLAELRTAGFDRVLRVELTAPDEPIAIVRLVVPRLTARLILI